MYVAAGGSNLPVDFTLLPVTVTNGQLSFVLRRIAGDFNDISALKIAPAPISIAVTPSNPSVALGNTQQFTATGTYGDGSTQNLTNTVTWSSSAPNAATINSAGLATSVTAGPTTINAQWAA